MGTQREKDIKKTTVSKSDNTTGRNKSNDIGEKKKTKGSETGVVY